MTSWRGLALPAALLALAEIGARAAAPSDTVAPPSAVAVALVAGLADGTLMEATRDTLVERLRRPGDRRGDRHDARRRCSAASGRSTG